MVHPVAVADNLSKTPLAEKVNEVQRTAPEADQRQAAQVVNEKQLQKQRETTAMEQTDEAIIHRDRQQRQQPQDQKQKKSQEDEKPQGGVDVTA